HDALLVSWAVAFFGMLVVPVAMQRRRPEWIQMAYGAIYTNCLMVTIAALAMVFALVSHDFSVSYVAQVGSRATPLFYTVISLWSALEGSILLWAFILSVYTVAFAVWSRRESNEGQLAWYSLGVLFIVNSFFLL